MLPADTQQYGSLYLGQIGKILEQTPWVGSVNIPVEVIPFPLNTEGKKKKMSKTINITAILIFPIKWENNYCNKTHYVSQI